MTGIEALIAFVATWVLVLVGLWIAGKIFPENPKRRK